jgi:hypothetical protein
MGKPMRPTLLPLLVLLAATPAIPTPATAEIRLSGDAAMGLTSSTTTTSAQVATDLDVKIQASRVTDGGVEFGAVLEMNANAGPGTRPASGYFFIQGGNN